MFLSLMVVLVFLAGCSDQDDGQFASESLPIVDLSFDEDGPADLAQLAEESDFVIVARIGKVEGGARFYGGTDEDLDPSWIEDLSVELLVEEAFKGDPGKTITMVWPGFESSEASSRGRSGTLRVEGVTLNGNSSKQRYLFFLRDHGEPWGLTATYLGAGVAQVNPADRITGQTSSGLGEFTGSHLDDLLERAGL